MNSHDTKMENNVTADEAMSGADANPVESNNTETHNSVPEDSSKMVEETIFSVLKIPTDSADGAGTALFSFE